MGTAICTSSLARSHPSSSTITKTRPTIARSNWSFRMRCRIRSGLACLAIRLASIAYASHCYPILHRLLIWFIFLFSFLLPFVHINIFNFVVYWIDSSNCSCESLRAKDVPTSALFTVAVSMARACAMQAGAARTARPTWRCCARR
jgi:uncharacterized membrane protein YsdA (DUF1294 family)